MGRNDRGVASRSPTGRPRVASAVRAMTRPRPPAPNRRSATSASGAGRRDDSQPGAKTRAEDVHRREYRVEDDQRGGPSGAGPHRRHAARGGVEQDRRHRGIRRHAEAEREDDPGDEAGHRPEGVFDVGDGTTRPGDLAADFSEAGEHQRDGEAAHEIGQDGGRAQDGGDNGGQREDAGPDREVDGVGPERPRTDGPIEVFVDVRGDRAFRPWHPCAGSPSTSSCAPKRPCAARPSRASGAGLPVHRHDLALPRG